MRRSLPIVAVIVVIWIVAMFSPSLSDVIFLNEKNSQVVISTNKINNEAEPTLIIFKPDNREYIIFETDVGDPTPDPPWPPDTSDLSNEYEDTFLKNIQ